MRPTNHTASGFTLIELSIVLVIIGLVIGGILVGKDMIAAAQVRAQLSQIEKFNQAVNTFRLNYNALPGDMTAATASAFGFAPRGQYAGEGDGNGIIEGVNGNCSGCNNGFWSGAGEIAMFWSDLTYANGMNINLIEGNFNLASITTPPASNIKSPSIIDKYFPVAKIGGHNSIIIWSGNVPNFWNGAQYVTLTGNWYSLATITLMGTGSDVATKPNMSVSQAQAIDSKIDDGFPTSGNVLAVYSSSGVFGAGTGGVIPAYGATGGEAASPSSTTCYDSNGVVFSQYKYSMAQNGGNGNNCALSFKMQ